MEARIKIIDTAVGENRNATVFGISADTDAGLAYTKGNTAMDKFPGRIAPGDRFTAEITATVGAELTNKDGKGIGLLALVPTAVDWATLRTSLPGYAL